MYKYLSVFFLGLFVIACLVGGYKVWDANRQIINLNNSLAASQKLEQETRSAYSIAAQKLSNLEAESKDLQKKIDGKNEEVAVLGTVNIKLKEQLFKIKNAKQTPIEESGISRIRVDFEKEQDLWKVEGFCITSPPEVELSVSWMRPLQLSFVLTKKNEQYRLYLDNNSPDMIAIENMSLRVDPSVFEKKWYQKIMISTDFGWSGTDPTVEVRGTFDIGSFSVGPFVLFFNGKEGLNRSIGASVGWRPF